MRLLFLSCLLLLAGRATAQFPDSIPVDQILNTDTLAAPQPLLLNGPDSTINLTRRLRGRGRFNQFFTSNYPDPKKALLLSTVLPGAGQVYNGQWWKAPLVGGALVGAALNIQFQTRQYLRFSGAYRAVIAGTDHEFTGTRFDDPQTLVSFRNRFNKSRQLGYVIGFAVYGLQALEAFVAAHLKDFDTEDDLGGWQVRPLVIPAPDGTAVPAYGVVYVF